MSANRYLPAAILIAEQIPNILAEKGLAPHFCNFILTETERSDVWLFAVMDESEIRSPESYATDDVLTYLSSELHGHLVLFSNVNGLRYAILLSPYRNFIRTPYFTGSIASQ